MRKTLLSLLAAALLPLCTLNAQEESFPEPSGTYLFATKDGQELYMDIYEPAEGSVTQVRGKDKPTILFVFGGGFKIGSRNEKSYVLWYDRMNQAGYRVIAIDYRLGLKDVKKLGIAQVNVLDEAIHMAVEDLFSATLYLMDNRAELGIDPSEIVLCGSSAGAITVMQAEYDICNSRPAAAVLPQDFNYAGVMSFSGAILSRDGAIRYAKEPAPTMMFHGTDDKLVTYNQVAALKTRFVGTNGIVPAFEKGGYNYNVYRFKHRMHEIATAYEWASDEIFRFIETNIMKGTRRTVDALIDDPDILVPEWAKASVDDVYAQD